MKKAILALAVSAIFFAGCESSDEKAEVSASQNPLSAGANANDMVQSEDVHADDVQAEAQGSDKAKEAEKSDAAPSGCSVICPDGMVCVGDMCIRATDDCLAPCDDGSECVNGVCISRQEVPADVCNPACADSEYCVNGQCVSYDVKVCDPECDNGTICIDGVCVKTAEPEDRTQVDCDGEFACDPTMICVSHHYCVPVCGAHDGEDILHKIDILYQVGVSQGDEQAKPGFTILSDQDALDEFVSLHYLKAVEGIDFAKDEVLAINSGVSGMGVRFELSGACDISGKSVMTAEMRYCAGEPMDAALAWQWIILRVPKGGNYDVEFVTNTHYCLK
ncbi:MAG: hypothetical protein IJ268_02475 [Proteobacteria bacterium]|nr:hypothetical protein [Pseudomonadota bacterium]